MAQPENKVDLYIENFLHIHLGGIPGQWILHQGVSFRKIDKMILVISTLCTTIFSQHEIGKCNKYDQVDQQGNSLQQQLPDLYCPISDSEITM
jgi:hypothetical protein